MKLKNISAVLTVTALALFATPAKAQLGSTFYDGTGANMANQPCPYDVSVGDGAASMVDDYKAFLKSGEAESKRLKDLQKKRDKWVKDITDSKRVLNASLSSEISDFTIAHIESRYTCGMYRRSGYNPDPSPPANVQRPPSHNQGTDVDRNKANKSGSQLRPNQLEAVPEDSQDSSMNQAADMNRAPAAVETGSVGAGGLTGNEDIQGFTEQQWLGDGNGSGLCRNYTVDKSVCRRFRGDSQKYSQNECQLAIEKLKNAAAEKSLLDKDIEESQALVDRFNEEQPDKMLEAEQKYTEAGGNCFLCALRASGQVSAGSSRVSSGSNLNQLMYVGANALAAGVSIWSDHQAQKDNKNMIKGWAQNAQALGQPYFNRYQGYPSVVAGFPFIQNMIYGATMGGTGSGSFGCNGSSYANGGQGSFATDGNMMYPNNGMNGVNGYPYSVTGGPQNGAMFLGGQGPWGTNPGYNGYNGYNNGINPALLAQMRMNNPAMLAQLQMNNPFALGNQFGNQFGPQFGNQLNPLGLQYGTQYGNQYNPMDPYGLQGNSMYDPYGMNGGLNGGNPYALAYQQQVQSMQNQQARAQALAQMQQEYNYKAQQVLSGLNGTNLGIYGSGSYGNSSYLSSNGQRVYGNGGYSTVIPAGSANYTGGNYFNSGSYLNGSSTIVPAQGR